MESVQPSVNRVRCSERKPPSYGETPLKAKILLKFIEPPLQKLFKAEPFKRYELFKRVQHCQCGRKWGLYIPRGRSLGSNRLVVRPPSHAPLPTHDYSTLPTVPFARDTYYAVLIVSAHVRCRSSQAQRDTLRSEADAASLQYKAKQQGESTDVSRLSSYLTEPRNDDWYNEVGILPL